VSLLAALGVDGGVVAIAGAGGKTALLYALAGEARAAGLRVLVTSTTHMGAPREGPAIFEEGVDRAAGVRAALDADGWAIVLGRRLREDKCEGLPPDRVDVLALLADLTVVEADGARQRSFKTPADHEPVVPASTRRLVVVAGLDVLGKPLDDAHVHRLERVAAAAGQPPGTTITAETLVRVLGDRAGYPARRPPGAAAAVFLNKVDDRLGDIVASIAGALVPPYDLVVAGRAQEGHVHSRYERR
jgi:probable selenium-dependent hydroxylase accessory protein YqeC